MNLFRLYENTKLCYHKSLHSLETSNQQVNTTVISSVLCDTAMSLRCHAAHTTETVKFASGLSNPTYSSHLKESEVTRSEVVKTNRPQQCRNQSCNFRQDKDACDWSVRLSHSRFSRLSTENVTPGVFSNADEYQCINAPVVNTINGKLGVEDT